MEFKQFQRVCKYMGYGIVDGYSSLFETTCRKLDQIPAGSSWGKCDEVHCPYYGVAICGKNAKLITESGIVFEVEEIIAKAVMK